MKVNIGCQGRFHLFDLAHQMAQLGHLSYLYTGYPKFKVRQLPLAKVSTFPWLMAPYMVLTRTLSEPLLRRLEFPLLTSFDSWVMRHLEPCDVYHCLSGAGLFTHQLARQRYGAVTFCDRASTHISYQEKLLQEEYQRCGLPVPTFDQRIVERELAEYELCDFIVLPSNFAMRSFVQENVPIHKLCLNVTGVNLERFGPACTEEDRPFRVLFVGQIGVRKGIRYLLEALAPLDLPHFELWLAGAVLPEARSLLSQYEGRFKYLGVIPNNRLSDVYAQCSVFVLPSVEDGLAYVQAEALACGLPVIATYNTGAADLFTDGIEGFIVGIRDPDAIREKVLTLYRMPELRKEMSRAASRCMQSVGGWRDYGQRAAMLYRTALTRGSTERSANPLA
jgi:alpha-maltose-1-phosphate synthase